MGKITKLLMVFGLAVVFGLSLYISEAKASTQLWSYTEYPEVESTIDTRVLVNYKTPTLPGTLQRVPIGGYHDLVVLGVSGIGDETVSGGNQVKFVKAVALDAVSGDVFWEEELTATEYGTGQYDVIKLQSIPDTNGDGFNEVLVSTIQPWNLTTVVIYYIDGKTGESSYFNSSGDNDEPVIPEYFAPLKGDFNGDRKKNNILIRNYDYTTGQSRVTAYEL